MAGTFINVAVEGGEDIRAALDLLKSRGQNLEPVFADIGEYLLISHYERFKRQESPEGVKWKDLNLEYEARKKKKRPAAGILVFDDYLAGTLNYEATAESLLFGTNLPYGATHQEGRGATTRKKTGKTFDANIPARPFLGLSRDDVTEAKRLIGEWLLGE